MTQKNIALLGFGTVGVGVYKLLKQFPDIAIKHILVKNPDKVRGESPPIPFESTQDLNRVVTDPNIDIVVEVMGGETDAYEAMKTALLHKKHVVTANKAVIAKHGPELFALANQSGVNLLFEAAVAGGIPVILPLRLSLRANQILAMAGILNGTCNYILTQMEQKGLAFDDALKAAQDLGFAEADPSADIHGHDAAAKISILAGIAHNQYFSMDTLYREGIDKITAMDIAMAKELGYTIRLIGLANVIEGNNKVKDVRVHPMLLPNTHPLANIYNENNALWLRGHAVGDLMFYGKGAGELPTASAVTGDILLIAKTLMQGGEVNDALRFDMQTAGEILPIGETTNAYYIRVETTDAPGVIGNLGTACGRHNVSIKAAVQKPVENTEASATIVLLTHSVKEAQLQAALDEIREQPTTKTICSVIRVLESL